MVYVHVPFCRSFCRYCGFYSELAEKGGGGCAVAGYVDDLCREAVARRAEIDGTLGVNTLYFGGGTPSVLSLHDFERIVESIGVSSFEEFTVEVNPDDIVNNGVSYVRGLLDLGVNRVSMGVQSLSDGVLEWMGRRHDAASARRAYDILRAAGVENVSVDIIFGIAGMTDSVLENTVRELVSWAPDHVSAYQLSVEEGSALDESGYVEADETFCRNQYLLVCELLRTAGYGHYEISNWALPGRRAVHNSAYWKRAPYVGLGPGAHSLIGRRRSWNSQELTGWTASSENLSDAEIREEEIMLGLRTSEGYHGRVLTEAEWFVSDSIIASLL